MLLSHVPVGFKLQIDRENFQFTFVSQLKICFRYSLEASIMSTKTNVFVEKKEMSCQEICRQFLVENFVLV